MDSAEYNARQRAYRKNNGNAVTKKYEKTKNGFLMRAYRNMRSRIEGIQYKKKHLYEGKFLLSKEDFYEWSLSNQDFHRLFEEWESSGYQRVITPSVDRKNSDFGYTIENMRWVPFTENCKNIRKNRRQ